MTPTDQARARELYNAVHNNGTIQQDIARIERTFAAIRQEAHREEREACLEIASRNSMLSWVGGSTGNAKETQLNIVKSIRNREALTPGGGA